MTAGRYGLALTIGTRFRFESMTWRVTGFIDGAAVHAVSTNGRVMAISLQRLVRDVTFSSLSAADASVVGTQISVLPLLAPHELERVEWKAMHVREVLTGFSRGTSELRVENEPRPEYDPTLSQARRIDAKAREVGVHSKTIENWIAKYRRDGVEGLVDGRKVLPRPERFGAWRDTAAQLLASRVGMTMVEKDVIISEVDEVMTKESPEEPIPQRSTKYKILKELDKDNQYFSGSTKGQQSRASVPDWVYRRKEASRPGQFIVMDTQLLDAYAMDPITAKWMRCQLTIAMDWCTRCVVGLSLTAHSMKAKDVGSVLYQVVLPRPSIAGKPWPYVGVPDAVVLDVSRTEFEGRPLGPELYPESIVVDHGRQYVSRHVWSACARFGIHVQPARKAHGSDKGILERFFKTLRQSLINRLPGYMGPDIAHRGKSVEQGAYYFIDELEGLIRDWIEERYHHRRHRGLQSPFAPGVDLSPAEMYELAVAKTGPIRVPARADLAVDFLPVVYRRINHYGIEINKLRYSGEVLKRFSNDRLSRLAGDTHNAGKWPIAFDPDDIRVVFFQDRTGRWHPLEWNNAGVVGGPFSMTLLRATKKLIDPAGTRRAPVTVEEILARLPLASATSMTARRALVRSAVMERDRLTTDARTYGIENGEAPDLTRVAHLAIATASDAEAAPWDDWAALADEDDLTAYEDA